MQKQSGGNPTGLEEMGLTIATELPPEAVEPEVVVNDTARPSLLYSWLIVVFLMVLYTSSFIDRQILSLLVKPIRADFHINDFQYSLLAGLAFVVTYSLAGLPIGFLVDRWSRRGIVTIGVTVWSIMTAACGVTTSFGTLFVTRIGVGIGEATLSPASYSLVSDLFPKDKLGRALSLYGLGIPIGSGLALVIGGQVIKAITAIGSLDLPIIGTTRPWQTVFLAIGLPGLLLAALTLLVVKEPKRHVSPGEIDHKPTLGEAVRFFIANTRIYAGLYLGMGLIAMYGYGSNVWYPSFLQRVHGFDVTHAGMFIGIWTLILGVAGCLSAGWLADTLIRRGRPDGHFIVSIFYCLGFAISGVIGTLAPVEWVSLTFVAISLFFSNTIIGVVAAALQILTPNRMRGQISSVFLAVAAFIGLAFGPPAVGFATDHIFHDDNAVGYSLALVAGIFPTLGAVAFWFGRKPLLDKLRQ
ncbi:MAG: major facilitator superfamily 1 [Rhodospirillales bacterium]|nr:major facilitator superfamily 1 [Rhodospirillales bacterium]